MKTLHIVTVSFLLICNVVYADAYKCTVDGEMIYSQLPCSNDERSVQQLKITAGKNEKTFYIAENIKIAEFAIVGLRAAMRDSQGCSGERLQKCQRFIDSVDVKKLTRIYADMMSDRLSEEDISNIYRFCKVGLVQKEAEITLVELKSRVLPDEPIRAAQQLTGDEIAMRDTFYKSESGKRYKAFMMETKDIYARAYQPYLAVLARQAGLAR